MNQTDPGRTIQLTRTSWLAGGLLLVLVISTPFYLGHSADTAARLRDQAVVANGFTTLARLHAERPVSELTWDAAVRHLDHSFNPEWAGRMIGTYYHRALGYSHSLVLDSAGKVIYAIEAGEPVPPEEAGWLVRAALPMLAPVRLAEARRPPLREFARSGGTIASPIAEWGIIRHQDTAYIVNAVLVQPGAGEVLPRGPRAPVVIGAAPLQETLLGALPGQFVLQDARLEAPGAGIEPGRAAIIMRGPDGETAAVLHWLPPKPGTEILLRAMPPMLVLLVLMMVFALWAHRRNLRVTRELISSEMQASHLAHHDTLTGLPNRLMLGHRLEAALARLAGQGVPFAMHIIDLDRFKDINDSFGHGAGDELICQVAEQFTALCGPEATLARIGGDEFAIIQPGAGIAEASALAGLLIERASGAIDLSAGRVFIGASIGIAILDRPGITASDVMRRADLALYRAKEDGRGRYALFTEDLDIKLRRRREIRDELRLALERGELTLLYQPQVSHGEIRSVEALVRWNHPVRGQVSPADFVPIAEETGLIDALGFFTLRRAFEDSRRLPGLSFAINVSAAQIRTPSFVPQLASLARETGIDPRRFELEITEGLLLGDDPQIRTRLSQIRRLGFSIALDDFGTGYSSLSYLQRFPITKIKIDRSFICNLGERAEADAVVAAIVHLSQALNLEVVAEGVETELQRVKLLAAGCSGLQGYLFGRPAPLDDIIALYAAPAPAASLA